MNLSRLDALQLAESSDRGVRPAGWAAARLESARADLRALEEESRAAAAAEEAGARTGAEACAALSPGPDR